MSYLLATLTAANAGLCINNAMTGHPGAAAFNGAVAVVCAYGAFRKAMEEIVEQAGPQKPSADAPVLNPKPAP